MGERRNPTGCQLVILSSVPISSPYRSRPSTASASGSASEISTPNRWAMHPSTTRPASGRLACSSSRIVSTDSSRAASMKAQVLTITTSARAGSTAAVYPASVSMADSLSESTWFLAQPRVVNQTVGEDIGRESRKYCPDWIRSSFPGRRPACDSDPGSTRVAR